MVIDEIGVVLEEQHYLQHYSETKRTAEIQSCL